MLSVLLGLAVGGALLMGLRTGHTAPAGRAAVSIILVALPSIPAARQAAARTLLIRAAAVVCGAVVVAAAGGHEVAVAVGIVSTAALGFTVPSIGPTAALAILMAGLRMDTAPGALHAPGLWELAGALVVVLAVMLVRHGHPGPADPDPEPAPANGWTVRRVACVAAAVLVALVTPLGIYGGHWLITAVLLSVRPTPVATRVRLTQRLTGNTIAAVLVAALMAGSASPAVLAGVVAVLTGLALALRPVSYLWWAMTAPPVLLIIGDYPTAHDWYEGMERVGLNVVGAVIVLAVSVVRRPRPRDSVPAGP